MFRHAYTNHKMAPGFITFCIIIMLHYMIQYATHPIHFKQNARFALRVAKIFILRAGTLSQPGPLKMTSLSLGTLLQVILHEIRISLTWNVPPLLNRIVVGWTRPWRETTVKGRERETINSSNNGCRPAWPPTTYRPTQKWGPGSIEEIH